MKNKYIRWGGVILVIIVAFFVYRYVGDKMAFARIDKGGEPTRARQYIAYEKNLIDRYKNDIYGSPTPEGTLAQFVEALKKEDVTLAANYFIPEKVKQMEEDLKIIVSNKRADEVAKEMSNYEEKNCLGYMAKCTFSTYYVEKKAWSHTELILNKYTQKWLIESL